MISNSFELIIFSIPLIFLNKLLFSIDLFLISSDYFLFSNNIPLHFSFNKLNLLISTFLIFNLLFKTSISFLK